jgi:hypothetical protein
MRYDDDAKANAINVADNSPEERARQEEISRRELSRWDEQNRKLKELQEAQSA